MKAFIRKTVEVVKKFLKIYFRIFGIILVQIGYLLMEKGGPYQTVTYIIEHLLRSIEIRLKVANVIETNPLYVSFVTEVSSSNYDQIDRVYFTMELVLQLGCRFTDINIYEGSKQGKNHVYYIDITKTALSNLEKGTPYQPPEMFDENDNEKLLIQSLELSKRETITPELLEKELNINAYRAEKLYNQLIKSKSLTKQSAKKRRLMN